VKQQLQVKALRGAAPNRPQPTPIVLQRKMACFPQVRSSTSHRQPIAPAVYRPQSKKVAQAKIVAQKPQILVRSSGPAPPCHVRTAATVLQRKMATHSRPATQCIRHPNVIQAAQGQWYQHPTTGVLYWFDGVNYYPYFPPQAQQLQHPQQAQHVPQAPRQQQPTTPRATSQIASQSSSSASTSLPPPPQQTQTQQSTTSTSSRQMSNNDFRNLVLNASRQTDPFAAVRAQTTLTGKLNQLRIEAHKSDESLERCIQELATGAHNRGAGIRGLASRLSDERYDASHEGHAHAENATFQLFEELLQLWMQRGKELKEQWKNVYSVCKKHQFDQQPPDRDKGGGGGLGGSTHAPRTKVFTF
jgi:hypothetical protein